MSRDDTRRGALLRGRAATALYFLLFGATLGCWTSRIPAIKADLDLSDGELGLALLAFAVGAIAGMLGLGRLVDRRGSFRVLVPTALLEGVLLVPTAFVPSLASLIVALFVFGTIHGTLNIAMNANAMEVQRAWGRPVVTSFHAVYSIGGFLGAAVGGVFAHRDVSPEATFAAVGAGVLVLALWAIAWTLRGEAVPPPAADTTPRAGGRPGGRHRLGLLLLGALAMCTLVGEGTAADWSAVYLAQSLGSTPAFAAAAFAAFSVAMTVGRLLGDGLAARFGPVPLVRGCGVLASAGMIAALLIGHPVAAVAGFACLGAGMSCIAPQVYIAAARRDPARTGAALSLVVSLGYVGFLVGPLVIGAVSTVTGLPTALGIPAVLILLVVVGASSLRPAPRGADATP
ncbi:MFS transporter [Streptomyces fragilis]|uniref:MFS transporter n=1 Tax=Streptomyces fragilis TaxID=67301 RepID=A0ABV2YHH8_9ACTN|nr:MFS transporter [Streptomyces fragilis]